MKSRAVPHLVELLRPEKNNLRELATAAVLMLSASTPNKPTIATSGAVPLLVQILIAGSIQVRVDAVTALYNLSSCENISNFILPSEAVKPLLTLLKDCKRYSKFAEKATGLLEILSRTEEFEVGILTLVETVEEGSLLNAEYADGVLLSLCSSCQETYGDLYPKRRSNSRTYVVNCGGHKEGLGEGSQPFGSEMTTLKRKLCRRNWRF